MSTIVAAELGQTGSAQQSDAVDISSTDAAFDPPLRGLYVGTGGTVIGRLAKDTADRTWKNVANGQVLPGCFVKVTKTNTTAADMLALR